MTFFKVFLGLFFMGATTLVLGQNHTLSGSIRDASTGEDLIGAAVVVKGTGTGTVTNVYGFYSLTLPAGDYTLVYSSLGFEQQEVNITLAKDEQREIELLPSTVQLKAAEVTGEKSNDNVTRTDMGVEQISMKEVESIPVLFGERDVMKTIQLLPGVKGAGEGNSGFYVRGGGIDQNLILLDEAPVYNPSHLLGFFSVFNSDALKDVTLYKGAIPAEYGGRASSVMDVRMKDGNSKELGVSGGIGLISSRLTLEGPIVKDKGSFIVSGRRTYADLFLGLSRDETISESTLYFYDLNLKGNYKLGEKDRLYVSGYFGQDALDFSDRFRIDWGNTTATLRWNHLYSDKLFSNTAVIYSDYAYNIGFGEEDAEVDLKSSIQDWNIKQDYSWYPNSKNTIKFGANGILHTFQTGSLDAAEASGFDSREANERKALEGAVYLQNEQTINARLSLNYGLRFSLFNQIGADTAYTFDDQGEVETAVAYGDWESMQFYSGLEPRASLRYQLNEQSSLKAGYNRNYQYMHLLSSSTTTTPTDLWVPSSNNIKPQIADQISLGYFRNLSKDRYEFSVETYYKDLQNLSDYKVGADVFLNPTIESELVFGNGYAYGAEFLLRKRKGRLNGWLSYTYSRTLREFDAIDDGTVFPAGQDRIHDLSIVMLYDLTEKVRLSANWVYNTGDAATFPAGTYQQEGNTVPYYTERNGYRLPDYHRLDLGVTWLRKQTEKFESSWNFSLYNAYGRENAYQITFEEDPNDPTSTQAVQLSLFRWVPSFSYNFKF